LDEASANVAYELTFLMMGILSCIYVYGVRRERIEIPREGPKLIAGICETAGQLAYVYAIGANAVGAAPIISCYCLVSVLWSRIILHEKLSWKHYAAIAIAAVGIVMMGAMDP
ncbi:MAG: EamA family transporter, partial [Clostridia bacterium]|nr:EamA family transporter [Clostridia bacterium]